MNEGTQGALGDAVVWTVDEVNEFMRDFQSDVDESSNLDYGGVRQRDPAADDVWTVDVNDADTGVRCGIDGVTPAPCCIGPDNIARGGTPAPPPGLGIITSACHVFPQSLVRTNDRFLFLTEIGGPPCLKPFLDKLIADNTSSPHWGGTLVIDQPVTLKEPIQLPSVFTLAGVGIHGEGRLLFEGDFGDTPAITFQEFDPKVLAFIGKSVIRDLTISGPTVANKMRGIKIGTARYTDDSKDFFENAMGRFQFHRVHVANFGEYGMQGGMNTYTTLIDHCELIGNGTNIQLIFQCNSWRIRDCFISGATSWGVDVGAEISVPDPPDTSKNPQSGVVSEMLISGCRFIGNKPGAIRIQPGNNKKPEKYTGNLAGNTTKNVTVFGNYFENNAMFAVQVESAVVIPDPMNPNLTQLVSPLAGTKIVSNFFGANEKVSIPSDEDYNVEPIMVHSLWTQFGFNVSSNINSILNTLKARNLNIFTILLVVAASGAFSIANIACDPQGAEPQAQEPGGVARALCDYTPAPRWVLRDGDGVRVQAMVEPRCGIVGDLKGQCLPLEFGPSGRFPCVRVIDHEGRYINLLYELATGLIGPCNLIYEDDVEKKWKVDRGALYLQEGCEGDPYTPSGSGFQYGNPQFTSPRVVTYADGNFWYPSELSCFDLETPQWEYSVETQECYVPPQFFDVCVYRPMATWVHELLPNPPYTMEVEYD